MTKRERVRVRERERERVCTERERGGERERESLHRERERERERERGRERERERVMKMKTMERNTIFTIAVSSQVSPSPLSLYLGFGTKVVMVKDEGRCGSLGPFVMATVRREVVAGRSDQALATPDHREGEIIEHWKVPLSTPSYTQDTELHTSRGHKHVRIDN